MRAYRRRFVLFNMLMVGIVLTAMIAGVAVYMYHDYYNSLQDTMTQVVKPLTALSGETADETASATDETPAAFALDDAAAETAETPTADAPDSEEAVMAETAAEALSAAEAVLPPRESAVRIMSVSAAQPMMQGGEPQPADGGIPAIPTEEGTDPSEFETAEPPADAAEQSPDDAPQQSPSELAEQPAESIPQPAGDTSAQKADGTARVSRRKDIAAVVYDTESDSAAVVTASEDLDEDTLETVLPLIAAQEEDFGTLEEYGLIYYRDSSGGAEAIALTDTGYIGTSMADLCLTLAAVWLCAMLCFFAVSLWLSKLAVRPMEQSAAREKQFVADVSHDLKTPLAVIVANNSILMENPQTPVGSLSRWVDSTGQAARQMQRLVDEMLTLSAAQRGSETAPVPIDLSDVVERAALQLESVAYDRQVTLETEIAEHITVSGSAESLRRIASGLMENAIKYEPAGGRVTVTLSAAKRQARLTVHNHGSLIPPETLPHVFDRFYRGDKSRGSAQGHGLGLAIVKQLTENLGGSITVRSSETEGTGFLVVLPRKESSQTQT